MATPVVSVILPFRNAAPTIGAALESLLGQTLRNLEIWAVDDCSNDGGREIAAALAESDPRLRVISSKSPHGIVAAVNSAWPVCRSDLIARMDADDLSLPIRLEKQAACLQSQSDLAAVSSLVEVPSAAGGFQRYIDWSNELTLPEQIHRERFVECPVVNPTMLARRSAIEAVGGHIDTVGPEDYDLWLRFLDAGHRIAKVPEVLYQWSDLPSRVTRTEDRYSEANFLRTKIPYLAKLPTVRSRGVLICGAGPIGKTVCQLLQSEGVDVHGFLEVSPRRIGQRIHGVKVLPGRTPQELPIPSPTAPVLLACVGSTGGRNRVRALLTEAGFEEGETGFVCCA